MIDVDWLGLIFREIEDPTMGRRQVVQTYGYLIARGHKDWGPVNRAILSRWSKSGLEWTKREAWKWAAGERKESL